MAQGADTRAGCYCRYYEYHASMTPAGTNFRDEFFRSWGGGAPAAERSRRDLSIGASLGVCLQSFPIVEKIS